jgi:hypothetical protein
LLEHRARLRLDLVEGEIGLDPNTADGRDRFAGGGDGANPVTAGDLLSLGIVEAGHDETGLPVGKSIEDEKMDGLRHQNLSWNIALLGLVETRGVGIADAFGPAVGIVGRVRAAAKLEVRFVEEPMLGGRAAAPLVEPALQHELGEGARGEPDAWLHVRVEACVGRQQARLPDARRGHA